MEMSLSPPLMKLSASLRFDSGTTALGVRLVPVDQPLLKALSRKK